jgi:TM2 domain-containing membrane protein YozV
MSDFNSNNGFNQNPASGQKSFTSAVLLSVFLGWLGVDRFYLGFTLLGVLKLAATLLSFGWLAWIWWIVDIILITTGKLNDSNGVPLRRG